MSILYTMATLLKFASALIASIFLTIAAIFLVTLHPFMPYSAQMIFIGFAFICILYGLAAGFLRFEWLTTIRALVTNGVH